jgi:signal transduction histidine kinase
MSDASFSALGEITAEIAHELRNAIQVIATHAFLGRRDVPGAAPHLAKIEEQARRAQAIIDDVLLLARGDAPKEPFRLGDAVDAACRAFDGRAHFVLSYAPDLRVVAHPGLLERLFSVLFENAVCAHAQDASATIEVSAVGDASGVHIAVADDGPGIPEELVARIFEVGVSGRKGGTGLGLALARRIVRAHGGDVRYVGGATGARFAIDLPN